MSGLPASAAAQPFFLGSGAEQRFCLFYPAHGPARGALLYLHPFGEEMNKARRMAALQCRPLAAQGYAVLQIDLHGCGDSAGEFADARWDSWLDDCARGCAWLHDKLGLPVTLWGLRLGALLALDHARSASSAPAALLLWQPVLNGAAFLTQTLRLRIASDMFSEGAEKTGTKELRESLRGGTVLEVAGYAIHPALADSLDALDAAAMAPLRCPVHWLEVVAAPERPMAPAGARVADAWRAAGAELQLALVACPPFWSTQEIAECPSLLTATSAIFSKSAS
jgi:exosortase A-associated hydrolase 2